MFCAFIGMRIAFCVLAFGVERLKVWVGLADEVQVKAFSPWAVRYTEQYGDGVTAYHLRGGGTYYVGEDGSFAHVDRRGRWT